MDAKDCLFCRIAKGEMETKKVYEDEEFVAFYDISPVAKKHIILIPKKHVEMQREPDEEIGKIVGKMAVKGKEIAKKEGISNSGFRFVMNTGDDSGRHFDHLHLHILGGEQLGNINC